jgi:hypothetical protein
MSDDRPWHRDAASVVRTEQRLNPAEARRAAVETEALLRPKRSVNVKGYVVRWDDARGQALYAIRDSTSTVREDATVFATIREAVIEAGDGFATARIVAVAEDGTETPLPSYQEAIEDLAGAKASAEQACALLDKATSDIIRMSTEIERLRGIVDDARRLIRSADLDVTSGHRANLTCDEEPYMALRDLFEAEREAERTIPGLVCTECDQPIYRGAEYAGRTGDAAHRACRNWPKGTTFKVAGEAPVGARRGS